MEEGLPGIMVTINIGKSLLLEWFVASLICYLHEDMLLSPAVRLRHRAEDKWTDDVMRKLVLMLRTQPIGIK